MHWNFECFQVVRKRRSTMWQKPETVKPPTPPPAKVVCSESASIDGGSCLSSSTSVYSSARSQNVRKGGRDEPRRKNVRSVYGGYNHIERQADAILKLLSSSGCSSEVKIRRVLGDSPDTSKALRMWAPFFSITCHLHVPSVLLLLRESNNI